MYTLYQSPALVYVQCDAGITGAQPMPLDSHGNFYPVFPGMPAFEPSSSSQVLQGTGAPDNSLGNNGNVYVNITNGDIYTKSGDVWTLVIGGAGAVQLMSGSVADPNGTVFPADLNNDALYSQDVAGNDNVQFWRWSIADQEWKDIITT